MQNLRKLLEGLKDVPEELPVEPELKHNRREKDKKLREEQDLAAGAVLEATVREGSGSKTPADGDLVFVHVTISAPEEGERATDAQVLYSTQATEGGNGQPLAFRLGKGWRGPRAWELALAGMKQGEAKAVVVKPGYGYKHQDCSMPAPKGVPTDKTLHFLLELVYWVDSKQVLATMDVQVFKTALQESSSWENPRPPTEVTFKVEARCLAYDGKPGTGFQWYATPEQKPIQTQLGSGQLPRGLAEVLGQMSAGEVSRFVLPAESMQVAEDVVGRSQDASTSAATTTSSSSTQQKQQLLLPPPPKGALQVELTVNLLELVQVRDLTGDGGVTKRRLRPGDGEFPMDCPLRDTTVTLHYRVRHAGGTNSATSSSSSEVWLYDSQQAADAASSSSAAGEAGPSSSSSSQTPLAPGWGGAEGAVTVDTGCGELPEGVELCAKMMVPGEVARVFAQPRYGYQGRGDAPSGLDPALPVEFEVQLVSFVKEGHWQNMEWEERWPLAERLKAKGNQLYSQQKFTFAINRYTYLLRLLESTRDYETDEQVAQVEALKLAALSNLAAAALAQGEGARAAEWCDKALELSPDSGKLLLRKAKALTVKGDYEEAEEQLTAAEKADAGLAADVAAARAHNKQRQRAASQKQRSQFKSFFRS